MEWRKDGELQLNFQFTNFNFVPFLIKQVHKICVNLLKT